MDTIELAKELLKNLEKQKGRPVHLKIETPEIIDDMVFDNEAEYLGSIWARPLELKRVENIDAKYDHDLRIIEGDTKGTYENFHKLEEWIAIHNPLYGYGRDIPDYTRALALLTQAVGEGTLTANRGPPTLLSFLHQNFLEEKLPEVNKILDKAGIFHLHYNIKADLCGIYVCSAGAFRADDDPKEKIADILFEKI